MTITMNLEIETGARLDEVVAALRSTGASANMEDGYLTGNFDRSNCYFVFKAFSTPEDVAAEGVAVDWKSGVNGAFHSRISDLSDAQLDIYTFLELYAGNSAHEFALSFQYESVYVIRDRSERSSYSCTYIPGGGVDHHLPIAIL